MGVITQSVMVQAHIDVRRMGQAQKVALADEIFLQQPNLLASILALPRMGVDMVQLEVPLHILLVTFQVPGHEAQRPDMADRHRGRAGDVHAALDRTSALQRGTAGLPAELASKVVQQFCDEHPERYLLTFVYGHLGDHGLLSVSTDAEKFLLLATLNLADCVAFVGATTYS